jgi:hypothetical protein
MVRALCVAGVMHGAPLGGRMMEWMRSRVSRVGATTETEYTRLQLCVRVD